MYEIGTLALAGLRRETSLWEVQDGQGGSWALLHVPSTGHASLVLATTIPGSHLDDPDLIQSWITTLGWWLTQISAEPALSAAAITIDAGPLPFETDDAAEVRIQLTWRMHGRDRGNPSTAAVALTSRIPWITASLSKIGIDAQLLGPEMVQAAVSWAYGLDDRPQSSPARSRNKSRPGTAGAEADQSPSLAPVAEEWSALRHGTSMSRTWAMTPADPATVLAAALAEICAPHREADKLRVTILLDRDEQNDDRQDQTEDWTGLRPTDLAPVDLASFDPAELKFALLVTVTVTDPTRLSTASLSVRDAPETAARPWLRPVYGAQAATFTAGLPTGTVLTRHAVRLRVLPFPGASAHKTSR